MTEQEAIAFVTVIEVLQTKRWTELAGMVDTAACAIAIYDKRLKRALREIQPSAEDVAREVA